MHDTQSTAVSDFPYALFVSGTRRPHPLVPIAATAGFRAIHALCHSCESLDQGVLVRAGITASGEHRLSTLEHEILVRPAVVIALTLGDSAARLITDIVLRSDALVGCLSLLGNIPAAPGLKCAVFGIASFDPSESLVVENVCIAADPAHNCQVPAGTAPFPVGHVATELGTATWDFES